MRRATIVAVTLLLASAPIVQAREGSQVSGTYTYELGGGSTTITIVAESEADRAGSGTFTFARSGGVSMEGNVTCVFINGQEAQVYGTVTHAVNTDATFFGVRVYDSEAAGGAGDMAISFAGPGAPPENCNIMPRAWGTTGHWMVPIVSGDIHVD